MKIGDTTAYCGTDGSISPAVIVAQNEDGTVAVCVLKANHHAVARAATPEPNTVYDPDMETELFERGVVNQQQGRFRSETSSPTGPFGSPMSLPGQAERFSSSTGDVSALNARNPLIVEAAPAPGDSGPEGLPQTADKDK